MGTRIALSTTPPSRPRASAASPRATGLSSTSCRVRKAPPPRTSPRSSRLARHSKKAAPSSGLFCVVLEILRYAQDDLAHRVRSFMTIYDPATGQIVRRQHHAHPISLEHPNLEL